MPPKLPLLALGFIALAFGIAGGLARLTPSLGAPAQAIAQHGALMVSAFFGSVISLERAVALGRPWGYAAPLAAGLGGLALLASLSSAGASLMVLAAILFLACSVVVFRRQPGLEMATLVAGAGAWLAGNLAFAAGGDAVAWWIAFFALTIGGERLELSRYLKRAPWVRRSFAFLAVMLLLSAFQARLMGATLLLLALWLVVFDLARVTIRQRGLPRYVAACLLAGYAWLGVCGLGLLAQWPADPTLHAFFVGFVFSMVFGHAPVILPAVLQVRFPYHAALYLPLALLHASLAARVLLSAPLGAWGNAAAIAVFIATAAFLVLRFDPPQDGRAMPR